MNVPIGRLAREELNRRQKAEKRQRLLARCRAMMADGHFRPTAAEIAGKGGEHDIGNLFCSLPALYEQAIDDETVRAIGRSVLGAAPAAYSALSDLHRIARAAVFGRLST